MAFKRGLFLYRLLLEQRFQDYRNKILTEDFQYTLYTRYRQGRPLYELMADIGSLGVLKSELESYNYLTRLIQVGRKKKIKTRFSIKHTIIVFFVLFISDRKIQINLELPEL